MRESGGGSGGEIGRLTSVGDRYDFMVLESRICHAWVATYSSKVLLT